MLNLIKNLGLAGLLPVHPDSFLKALKNRELSKTENEKAIQTNEGNP
jgi:hypothetical protein